MQRFDSICVHYHMSKTDVSRAMIAGGLAGMLLTAILLGFFFAELPTGLVFWICGAACLSPIVFAAGLFFHAAR